MSDQEQSPFVQTHVPCEECGSSDARSIRADGSSYCFACQTSFKPDGESTDVSQPTDGESSQHSGNGAGLLRGVSYEALSKRGITEETAKKWSYGRVEYMGRRVHVAQYCINQGRVVAQKLRLPDKTFPWKGDRKAFTGLYGQWLWSGRGPRVVVTEGEIDALTVSQLLGNKWPVVSLPDGAQAGKKAITQALEWLSGYDKIILMLDNDKHGKEATEEICPLLPPGKAYIATLPADIKDPNDAHQKGQGDKVISAMWEARQWVPDGFVSGADLIERYKNRPEVISIPYPDVWREMNAKTYGMRLGELDTWTSGTGMGKTTIIKAIQHHIHTTTNYNQALIHLEEPIVDTMDDLVGYHMGHRIKLPDIREQVGEDAILEAIHALFEAVDGDGHPRFQLFDAFGSVEGSRLYTLIRFVVQALGCRFVWLDHLSIMVSDLDEQEDERRTIDRIMSNLKKLTVELGCYIGLIVHLRKTSGGGKSFEEGAVPSLDDLRGSGGIKQLSNGVYAASRNQQHEDPVARNTTSTHVLKCRFTGRTGMADHLYFDDASGRLVLGVNPSDIADTGGMQTAEDY